MADIFQKGQYLCTIHGEPQSYGVFAENNGPGNIEVIPTMDEIDFEEACDVHNAREFLMVTADMGWTVAICAVKALTGWTKQQAVSILAKYRVEPGYVHYAVFYNDTPCAHFQASNDGQSGTFSLNDDTIVITRCPTRDMLDAALPADWIDVDDLLGIVREMKSNNAAKLIMVLTGWPYIEAYATIMGVFW